MFEKKSTDQNKHNTCPSVNLLGIQLRLIRTRLLTWIHALRTGLLTFTFTVRTRLPTWIIIRRTRLLICGTLAVCPY